MDSAAPTNDIFSVMTVRPLAVSTATAERVALERWGIGATARALTGERDRNFRLRATDGREFVLKFANPAEDPAVTDMQIHALRRIARLDPDLPVPRIVPLPDGTAETPVVHETGAVQRVRLLSWLPGLSLRDAPPSAAQRTSCGRALGRVQLALAGFTHPAARHALIWDMQHALCLREVMHALPDARAQAALGELLDEFAARVVPALPHLRRQVLYNDMNGLNTLVDAADPDRFAGLIDFGDMVETALVIDVATGCPAQLGADMPAAAALGHFVAGVHAVQPLAAEEVALLPLLIALRITMSIFLQAWHRHVQPDNPHYDDVTEDEIIRRLAAAASVRTPEVAASLRRACGLA